MAKETIKCKCGKDSKYSAGGGVSFGDFIEKTGWKPVPLPDGMCVYLCKECAAEAIMHGKRLVELTGSEYCVVPSLSGKYGEREGE